MSWANVGFIVVLVMALALWVAFDPAGRAQFARRRTERRAARRARAEQGRIERADHDALHRHYRTSVRYYQAGGDPGELAPVWLPSKGPHPGTGSRSPESSSR